MAVFKISGDQPTEPLTQFLLPEFQTKSLTATTVTFGYSVYYPDEYDPSWDTKEVTYTGKFDITDGIASGVITKVVFEAGYSSSTDRTTLTITDGAYIEDFEAFQKSGKIGIQLLLAGNDDLYDGISVGYGGNDTFHAKRMSAADGGTGHDVVIFDSVSSARNLDLNRDAALFKSIEEFIGSKYNDQMRGSAGADLLNGGVGHDLLIGREGNDTLVGGNGNDRFIGGPGIDTMTGGSGRDVFVFEKFSESKNSAMDRVTDFDRAYDLIDMSVMDANTEKSGNQTFTYLGDKAFTGHAGELRSFISGGSTIVRADVDGDKITDFQFALSGSIKLTSLDFIL